LVRVDERVDGRCEATEGSSSESRSHRPGIARSLRSRDREIGRPRRRPSSRCSARGPTKEEHRMRKNPAGWRAGNAASTSSRREIVAFDAADETFTK